MKKTDRLINLYVKRRKHKIPVEKYAYDVKKWDLKCIIPVLPC